MQAIARILQLHVAGEAFVTPREGTLEAAVSAAAKGAGGQEGQETGLSGRSGF